MKHKDNTSNGQQQQRKMENTFRGVSGSRIDYQFLEKNLFEMLNFALLEQLK